MAINENDIHLKLKTLLDSLYEAEALTEMALRRDDAKISARIAKLVAAKCFSMADAAAAWQLDDCEIQAPASSTYAPEFPAEEPSAPVPVSVSTPAPKPASTLQENILEAEASELDPEILAAVDKVPYPQPKQPEQPASAKQPLKESAKALKPAPKPAAAPKPKSKFIPAPESKPQMLSLFTLNDRFRFRASLFKGINDDFIKSLKVMQDLDSLDEAQDYLVDDLGFDPEGTETVDFLNIISRYYKK